MRVYRLAVPLTVLGMDLWALFTVAFGTLVALQFWQDRAPALLSLPLAGLSGFALSKLVGLIKHFFPGRALWHVVAWLTQGDRYRVQRDVCSSPLIVPREDRFLVRPSRKQARRVGRAAAPSSEPLQGGVT
ncbi:hypothetical protein [Deinococcus planocerae]|uniref:hypothetical protein n=1 Tax=Deinococcus planocerae TaxID=1737569 RepID=UPI0011AFC1E4|nr:hypothetical protein [Deinococcus planocerae]